MTDCILTRKLQEKKNGFTFLTTAIMLNPQYNGAAQKVQATREEKLVLTRGNYLFNGQLSCRSYAKISKSLISLQLN